MKKVSTVAAKQRRNISQEKLTIGLDLGDRSSCYCVLDGSGCIVQEQRVSTAAKALREVFGGMPRSRIALETGMRCCRYHGIAMPSGPHHTYGPPSGISDFVAWKRSTCVSNRLLSHADSCVYTASSTRASALAPNGKILPT